MAVLAGSSSGERDGTITERMEENLEGLFVCRGPSHPTSTLACCRAGQLPVRAGDPEILG